MSRVTEEHEKEKERTRAALADQLKRWEADGLIRDGHALVWDTGDGCWHIRFHVSGVAVPYEMTEAEFENFSIGFNDRRTALMHRTPTKTAVKKGRATR